jgi:type VI secretion system secreted protein Hcp
MRRNLLFIIPLIFLSLFLIRKFTYAQEVIDTSLAAGSPSPAPFAGEPGSYFLKLSDTDGESVSRGHEKEIDILSFSWGETNEASRGHGAGGGAGKVSMQDFHFVKKTDKSSPLLMLACANGKHFPEAVLSLRKAGGESSEDYIKWKLSDVMCSSFQTGGSGPDVPTDEISFNFSKIEFEYKPQNSDGTLLPAVQAGWNLKEGKR